MFDPGHSNFHTWEKHIYFQHDMFGKPRAKFLTVKVELNAQIDMLYQDGIDIYNTWLDYVDEKRSSCPVFLRQHYFVVAPPLGAFAYFIQQQTISFECFFGTGLALFLASLVLLLATRNIVLTVLAVVHVAWIVVSAMAFSYWMGWKPGMLEA